MISKQETTACPDPNWNNGRQLVRRRLTSSPRVPDLRKCAFRSNFSFNRFKIVSAQEPFSKVSVWRLVRDFRVLMPLIVSLSIPYEKTRLPSGPDQFGHIFVTPEANPGRSSGVRPVTPEALKPTEIGFVTVLCDHLWTFGLTCWPGVPYLPILVEVLEPANRSKDFPNILFWWHHLT